MADEQPAEAAAPAGKKFDLQTVLLLVNFLAVAAAAGTLLYTRVLYKKPQITESQEKAKLAPSHGSESKEGDRPLATFDELRVNIASTGGRSHFATFQMTAECVDEEAQGRVESQKDKLVDKMIAIFNRKEVRELTTVQGRLVLKEELVHAFNGIVGDGSVTDVMFSSFTVQ